MQYEVDPLTITLLASNRLVSSFTKISIYLIGKWESNYSGFCGDSVCTVPSELEEILDQLRNL